MSGADEVDELLNEFLVESHEGLDQLDRDLVELEQNGPSPELIARVFRCVHTIKGTCGFFGYGTLESVAHVGENLLTRVRDGSLTVTPPMTSALLAMIDAIRFMLQQIEQHGTEGDADYSALVTTLAALADGERLPLSTLVPYSPPADPAELAPVIDLDGGCAPASPSPLLGELLVRRGDASALDVAAAVQEQEAGSKKRVGEILVERGMTSAAAVKDALETQQDLKGGLSDSSIRVDVALLDRLMNLVGELVLARNQILQATSTVKDDALLGTTQRLNLITSELQEGVMKTRMQPIGNVWSKFPRVVRDLAVTCGKQVTVTMEGAETELDKTIIEAIKDPLTHIVRNSVDHGIESPRERVLSDKSPEGRLVLRAFHEGGQVNIEITDDGGGIDPAKLRAKAVEKGLLTQEAGMRLGDHEALQLIFAAGFSTAAKVTNVSGRGVGMDVVKTNIEKIGGTVDVQSVVGQGTTLRIKIPLTLAIIPALVVTSGGERFAIPQVSLLELVRLEPEHAAKRIEMIYGAPVYRLRGKLLPLVHLNHALELATTPWPGQPGAPDEPLNIIVLQTDGVPFGLIVDGINDTEEIVVKPLGAQLKGLSAFAGATIMGDGHVALILDVHGLAQRANIIGRERDRQNTEQEQKTAREETHALLLFGYGTDHRMAIPLSEIARLEEIPCAKVERTGRHEVVQYRDNIMPLVRLTDHLEGIAPATDEPEMLQVIVYANSGEFVGLVVDRILDVVDTSVNLQRRRKSGPILGTAVIQEKVTDVLDIRAIVASVEEEFLSEQEGTTTGELLLHA
jgi:two-component system, chemotaxis family, sensor kinase CheA